MHKHEYTLKLVHCITFYVIITRNVFPLMCTHMWVYGDSKL